MINRLVVISITVSGVLLAQQQATPGATPATNETTQDSANSSQLPYTKKEGPQSAQWKGLTVKEKLKYDWIHLFDVENVAFAGVGASFDQLRDHPGQWGEGGSGFAERFGSHIGQYAIQRSIMFPVQAIDEEDTRYFPSTRTSIKGRIGDALFHTIWRHDDTGGMMPAYSEFLGDYGAAAAARMLWWPQQYRHGSAIFIAGSDTLLVDAGINVFHEFKPDIKRWLHMTR